MGVSRAECRFFRAFPALARCPIIYLTMDIKGKIHCLFEQSGTFKNAFQQLGFRAVDYDIRNDFGQTDVVVDIFKAIKESFAGRRSFLDKIKQDDLVLAFFPCIYFNESNEMYFCGTSYNLRAYEGAAKLRQIITRANQRHEYYTLLLKLCCIAEARGWRMIIENPYNAHHYLRFNFPYKPAVIDMNRRLSGDYYRKPTQFIFVGCEPTTGDSIQLDKPERFVNNQSTVNRSIISSDYARNFILDKILGIRHEHSVPTLF